MRMLRTGGLVMLSSLLAFTLVSPATAQTAEQPPSSGATVTEPVVDLTFAPGQTEQRVRSTLRVQNPEKAEIVYVLDRSQSNGVAVDAMRNRGLNFVRQFVGDPADPTDGLIPGATFAFATTNSYNSNDPYLHRTDAVAFTSDQDLLARQFGNLRVAGPNSEEPLPEERGTADENKDLTPMSRALFEISRDDETITSKRSGDASQVIVYATDGLPRGVEGQTAAGCAPTAFNDPGRDGRVGTADDVSLRQALDSIRNRQQKLVLFGYDDANADCYQAIADAVGGVYLRGGQGGLVNEVPARTRRLLNQANVTTADLRPNPEQDASGDNISGTGCVLRGDRRINPQPPYRDKLAPFEVEYTVDYRLRDWAQPGQYTCRLVWRVDGVRRAVQQINVTVQAADGSTSSTTNPGGVTTTQPGGDVTTTQPGGDVTTTQPGGDVTTTQPGGDGTTASGRLPLTGASGVFSLAALALLLLAGGATTLFVMRRRRGGEV